MAWYTYVNLKDGQPKPTFLLRSCVERVGWPLLVLCNDESDAQLQAENLRRLGYDAFHGEGISLDMTRENPNDY